MKVGYVRVSKQEQHETLQVDALREAGCEELVTNKSNDATFERKELEETLAYVWPDTVVLWKLDWLGRSFKHLHFSD